MSSNVLVGRVGLKIRRVSVASDADHASVLSNDELEKFRWFENRTDAEADFLRAIADE